MRYNILIGGKAGQGINKISQIISEVIKSYGYFTFNYRDYPSLIRGGHNFNVLCFSDKKIQSQDSKLDFIVALDERTIEQHKKELNKKGIILDYRKYSKFGKNLNIALSGALVRDLGIGKEDFLKIIKKNFKTKEAVASAIEGYESSQNKINLKKLKNKTRILSGSQAVAVGAVNSGLDCYIGYPMTPATGVMHELASNQKKHFVFQSENEVGAINEALGASFAGAITMTGTSGGGFDLMSEGLSLQGSSEIPMTVYLASRPGPATGVPTYTSLADLNIALYSGHGEFPRVVAIPGDVEEAKKITNEALYLANKFNILSIILSDKHLAESEYSFIESKDKWLKVKRILEKRIRKASSYEKNEFGNSTEDYGIIKKNADKRFEKMKEIEKELQKFETYKIYGKKDSKNLIVGTGSTKGAILDAIEEMNVKFLQIIYASPFDKKIESELKKAKKIILVENNKTAQLGDLIKKETGIEIKDKILKYDGRPFTCDELKEELARRLR